MTAITFADIKRMREFMDAMQAQPQTQELFLVVPEQVVFDCAREADRLAITQTITDQDGALKINVLHVRDGQELTFEQRDFLAILNSVKLVKQVPLMPLMVASPSRDSRLGRADHMASLRKFTGNDWRGRRG